MFSAPLVLEQKLEADTLFYIAHVYTARLALPLRLVQNLHHRAAAVFDAGPGH